MSDKVTDKVFNRGLSQPDYHERVEAAIKRPNVSSAVSEEMAAVGWHHMEWCVGDISSVRILEADIVDIWLYGSSSLEHADFGRSYHFRFRKPEPDFIAEARRSQSHDLGFEFAGYVKYPSAAEGGLGPFRVQQITYYEVWGRPLTRVLDGPRPLRVEVSNQLLPVKVVEPRLTANRTLLGGDPVAVSLVGSG